MASSSSGSTYWSQPTVIALPSESRGSDLWTSARPGIKEIWSNITYALAPGEKRNVKIFLLETSLENRRRLVGPTFHTPQEAQHFLSENTVAWPGDREPLSLADVRSEGLLKAWSKVWSAEVETCIRASAESTERFIGNFNMTSSMHVRLPKTFVDQLLIQIHKDEKVMINPQYSSLGRGYYFPEQPPDDSDGTDMPDTPIYRRVYAFTSVTVSTPDQESIKHAFVRSRIKGDQYFVAVTPDYGFDDMDEMKAYFAESLDSYPLFDFDAKWMLEHTLSDF